MPSSEGMPPSTPPVEVESEPVPARRSRFRLGRQNDLSFPWPSVGAIPPGATASPAGRLWVARAGLTSALATASDFAAASLLHRFSVPGGEATFLGCAVGGAVAFSVNRMWTFRARQHRALPQLVRFLLVWASSALLNALSVAALMRYAVGFSAAWVTVRGAICLGWNYPLLRWFVFAPPSERQRHDQRPRLESGLD